MTRTLSEDETYRRIPALDKIETDSIREETARLTANAPDYFWEVPASSSGHHHPMCRKDRGLWAHTLMVTTVVDRMSESYRHQGRLSKKEVDCAFAAAILHDQRKNGSPENPQEKSTSDHDIVMAEVAYESSLPSKVGDAIATHMGPWYDGPTPQNTLQQMVHQADMVASTFSVTPKGPSPLPSEVKDLGMEEY